MSNYNFIQLLNTGGNLTVVPVVLPPLLVINAPNRAHHNEIDAIESSNKSKDKTKLRPIAIRKEATAASSNDGKIDIEFFYLVMQFNSLNINR